MELLEYENNPFLFQKKVDFMKSEVKSSCSERHSDRHVDAAGICIEK